MLFISIFNTIILGHFINIPLFNNCNTCNVSNTSYLDEFNKFIIDYRRNYTKQQYKIRYNIFRENMIYINQVNSANKTYKLGINNFTDLANYEFEKLYLQNKMDVNKVNTHNNYHFIDSPIPDSIDYRAFNYVTNVKNQGQCGSCWAFSAVGAIEGFHAKNTSNLTSLSEQNLVDCVNMSYNCAGCAGGWPDRAMQYVIDNKGIDSENSYSYIGNDEQCKFNSSNIGANITNVVLMPPNNMTNLYNALGNIGPLSVALDATYDFQLYKSGIFETTQCSKTQLDHAVLAIGYGKTTKGNKYLIIKNSWGDSWGMDGFIYYSTNIDNMCGIAAHVSYPY